MKNRIPEEYLAAIICGIASPFLTIQNWEWVTISPITNEALWAKIAGSAYLLVVELIIIFIATIVIVGIYRVLKDTGRLW